MEGRGDLVSGLITPMTQITTPAILVSNLSHDPPNMVSCLEFRVWLCVCMYIYIYISKYAPVRSMRLRVRREPCGKTRK